MYVHMENRYARKKCVPLTNSDFMAENTFHKSVTSTREPYLQKKEKKNMFHINEFQKRQHCQESVSQCPKKVEKHYWQNFCRRMSPVEKYFRVFGARTTKYAASCRFKTISFLPALKGFSTQTDKSNPVNAIK